MPNEAAARAAVAIAQRPVLSRARARMPRPSPSTIHHTPCAALLNAARAVQAADARGQAAQQRAEPERGQADLEDAAPADPVGGGAGQHQEAGQHQGVRVHRPLQAGLGGVQVTAMAGSATLTMEMSMTTTKMLVQQMARTSHRRRSGRAGELMATTLGFRACSKST